MTPHRCWRLALMPFAVVCVSLAALWDCASCVPGICREVWNG